MRSFELYYPLNIDYRLVRRRKGKRREGVREGEDKGQNQFSKRAMI